MPLHGFKSMCIPLPILPLQLSSPKNSTFVHPCLREISIQTSNEISNLDPKQTFWSAVSFKKKHFSSPSLSFHKDTFLYYIAHVKTLEIILDSFLSLNPDLKIYIHKQIFIRFKSKAFSNFICISPAPRWLPQTKPDIMASDSSTLIAF